PTIHAPAPPARMILAGGRELSQVGFLGADRHIRGGGRGVDVGRGRLRRPRPGPVHAFPPARATQASPPTPSTTPAPTGTKGPPRRSHKKPPPERLCWRMTFLIEAGRNGPQMEVKRPPNGPGFGDHQAQFHSVCHSPTKS